MFSVYHQLPDVRYPNYNKKVDQKISFESNA
jgi:hypothetical protein